MMIPYSLSVGVNVAWSSLVAINLEILNVDQVSKSINMIVN